MGMPDLDLDLELELLEPLLRRWVSEIGLRNTLLLVERFGGVRMYVPNRARPDHPIAELIGFDAFCALARLHGADEHFRVPKAAAAMRELRDRSIRASNLSIRRLALTHRLTERRVQQIRGAYPSDAQPGLFD